MSRKVLLVTPVFHDYWKSVAAALEARGDQVRAVPYDLRTKLLDRAAHQVLVELPAHAFGIRPRRAEAAAATLVRAALEDGWPDTVLVVRGDLFGDDGWDAILERRLPTVLWLYDELDRVPQPTERLRAIDLVASYSPSDVARLTDAGVSALLVPNAHDHRMSVTPRPGTAPVFVGARYPGRERTLTALHAAGVEPRLAGRDWSHHPFDRLRTWSWHRPDLRADRDVPRHEALARMAGAPCALNLHERQDGFTMRTFEAAGVGALQLIDRADVGELYEPDVEVVPFGGVEELAELCRRAQRDAAWRTKIGEAARRRTEAEHTYDHRVALLAQAWS